jgi:predicted MFS family arabinose efflux permease
VATLARIFINTARRFVYPFAPVLSRALGVPLPAITSLIAINQATGLLSPVLGPLADSWGYRTMMLAGLALLTAGMLLAGWLPFYLFLMLGLILAGLGKSMYDPSLRAWVGKYIPFTQRGRAIGLIEIGWAGASLIGIPAVGLMIERWGWRSPFFVLGGLCLLSLVVLRWLLPADRPSRTPSVQRPNLWAGWRFVAGHRMAWAALLFGFLLAAANDNLFVVYGVWLEERYQLGVAALGTATTAIGVAELLGEGLTATLADRIGLRRALIGGVILSSASYALLPLLPPSLPLALAGLFLVFLTFEFTIVTSLSLFTEVVPEARATMMSSYEAASGLGRVLGALLGGAIWLAGGLPIIGFVSAGASLVALLILVWGLRHWQH